MWQGLVTYALEQNFFRPHISSGREMLLFIPILQIRKLRLRVVMHIPRTRWNLNQGPSDSFLVPADVTLGLWRGPEGWGRLWGADTQGPCVLHSLPLEEGVHRKC